MAPVCPGAGGSFAIAAATAARAARLASSMDLDFTGAGLVAGCSGKVGTESARTTLPDAAFGAPFATGAALSLGLERGMAGTMRPLFGPVGMALAECVLTCATGGAGGASAAATSGLDSTGGGGPFC